MQSAVVPVFNPTKFDSGTLGDPALQRRLIALFLGQGERHERALLEAVSTGQGAFRSALHDLKNDAHFIAADRMLEVIESLAPHTLESDVQRRSAVEALTRELKEIRIVLAQFMSTLPSGATP